jgi:hypothetical protein
VLLSCELPSHVADFLRVTAWLDSEGHELGHGAQGITCYSPMLGGGGGIRDVLFGAFRIDCHFFTFIQVVGY